MSYLVLARKHRPQLFKDFVGQEHISQLLTKAIEGDRIAHSYLFCGPRGVGKTSCARILAKSLNCEKGPTITPCGECSACQEISKSTSFDVLEIDGASNRGIDEIRTLRENVKFAPSYGRYKIYIVDEVHMLTTEAFNALLKTLEEPPAHAKFIFATTEPHKVPATILSRCQRFDFKHISINTILDLLADICKKENFTIEEDALYAIAKAAKGSLRDALSVLDQLSALSEITIEAGDVYTMLGIVETQLLFDLGAAIGQKNSSAALEVLDQIVNQGKDLKQLLKDMTEHFRNLLVIKIGGKSLGKLVDYPVAIKEMYLKQCDFFEVKAILNIIDAFIETQEMARLTESMRIPFELALAKLTFQEEGVSSSSVMTEEIRDNQKSIFTAQRLSDNKGQVGYPQGQPAKDGPETRLEDVMEEEAQGEEIVEDDIAVGQSGVDFEKIKNAWDSLTYALSKEKMSLATYLQEAQPIRYASSILTIAFPASCVFQKESMESQENVLLVERIFSDKVKENVIIKYIIDQDVEVPENSGVKDILAKFDGEVVGRWHND